MLVPIKTLTSENVFRTIERTLPVKGRVLVKMGQEVRPETVVGSCWRVAGFKNYNLARLLNLRSAQVKEALLRPVGAQVYQGTVIARTKKLLGLKTVEFVSPISGVLHAFSEKDGVLTVQQAPQEYRLVAGVGGVIDKIVPGEKVEIGAVVSEVKGTLAAGNDREGVLKIVSGPDIAIAPQAIDKTCRGRIIVGGALLSKEVIHKCLALGVRGVVCGGIHWQDFDGLVTLARGRLEDVGLTIFITEGFGYQPMHRRIFDFLTEYENRFGMILSGPSRLVIPLSLGDQKETKPVAQEPEFASPRVGDMVRLISPPRLDEFGKIRQLLTEPEKLESGLVAEACEVEVGEEGKKVAVRNLEIVR